MSAALPAGLNRFDLSGRIALLTKLSAIVVMGNIYFLRFRMFRLLMAI